MGRRGNTRNNTLHSPRATSFTSINLVPLRPDVENLEDRLGRRGNRTYSQRSTGNGCGLTKKPHLPG